MQNWQGIGEEEFPWTWLQRQPGWILPQKNAENLKPQASKVPKATKVLQASREPGQAKKRAKNKRQQRQQDKNSWTKRHESRIWSDFMAHFITYSPRTYPNGHVRFFKPTQKGKRPLAFEVMTCKVEQIGRILSRLSWAGCDSIDTSQTNSKNARNADEEYQICQNLC